MKDASANKLLHILEVIAIDVKTHRHKTSAHRNETTSQSEETLRGFECVELALVKSNRELSRNARRSLESLKTKFALFRGKFENRIAPLQR